MESDWPRRNKSYYVTEIVSWLGFADVIFGGHKRQPEIRLRSQAMNAVEALVIGHLWDAKEVFVYVTGAGHLQEWFL